MAEQATQQGIEIKLDNGNVIKASSTEEALKIAAKMIEDNSKAYRETKANLDTLQGNVGTLQSQLEELRRPPQTNTHGLDTAKYWNLYSTDPIAAQNYLDSVRFGISDPNQVPQYLTGINDRLTRMEGSALGAGFASAHPEYPNTEEAAKMMTERVQQLGAAGHPFSYDTLDLAWGQLQAEGRLSPVEKQTEEVTEIPPSPQGAGGVISTTEEAKVEQLTGQMTMAQLEAYMREKGVLR
jgi:hypothetical protein